MALTLILGPMKSGKSFDLISQFAPLKYADIPFRVYQSARNVRDKGVRSRAGIAVEAEKIARLSDIDTGLSMVGIDEVHMFVPSDIAAIRRLLDADARVVVAGLDMDYRGVMFDIVRRLLELGPDSVIYKRAVCDECKSLNGTHTQLMHKGKVIMEGVPSVVPDDGTYVYRAVCHRCFRKGASQAQ
jgi:thymidine kinase